MLSCTIVITLSSPIRSAPVGKLNLSSVSSRIRLLFVELKPRTVVRTDNVVQMTSDTNFPKDVLRNTSFSQTLAAKAVIIGRHRRALRSIKRDLPSPPLMDRLTDFSEPVALK